MLKKAAAVVAVLAAAFLVFVATRPDTYTVQRSASIQAPAEAIYPLICDFHNWPSWSPWEKLDPQMKRTFNGLPAGTGAIYEWLGNDQVGQGRMQITEAQASS